MICGIWHGAKLSFVIFGVLQVSALIWDMYSKDVRQVWSRNIPPFIYNTVSWLLTFIFIVFCFIFFRANTTAHALLIVKREFTTMFDVANLKGFLAYLNYSRVAFSLLLMFGFICGDRIITRIVRSDQEDYATRRVLLTGVLFAMTLALGVFGKANFIYFQF
jgi:D-alanyl-lipoteichoic acid acyltransferase DltB (MBOAT superfamily)